MKSYVNNNNYSTKKNIGYLLIILLSCIIAYWPLSTGIFSLKNDIIVYFLPIRFQISDLLRHGEFPFWTPYINLGHPLYTDMQSGVWNPIVWIISLFGTYTMRSVQIEIMLYLFLCGANMFFLLKHLKISPLINIMISISFMLCGFNSDTIQTLYWISGMAFLPLAFLFLLKTLYSPSLNSSLIFGFTLYLLFATAYPGEVIIIGYLLVAFIIAYLIIKKNNTITIIKKLLLSAITFGVLALPALIAYFSGLNYIERGNGVDLELALSNSMHPYSNISYIFPLTVWKLKIPETDVLGRNSYFGLFPFLLLLISFLIRQKEILVNFLKWTFIISLILSLGKYGFVRALTYYLLPYMDTFRHPSMFRFLSIFSGCILAAQLLQKITTNYKAYISPAKNGSIILIAFTILSIFILFNFAPPHFLYTSLPSTLTLNSIKSWIDNSSIVDWLIIDLLLQIPMLFILYMYFIKKLDLKILVFASIINSITHTAIIQPISVVGIQTVRSFQSKINSIKNNEFALPDINKSIFQINQDTSKNISIYGPLNVYNKKIGYQFYFVTPGPLLSHKNFMSISNLHNSIFNFPLLFRADTALRIVDTSLLPINKPFIITDDLTLLKEINNQPKDSFITKKTISFNPNRWEIEVSTSKDGFFCLTQNYYPNWRVIVDNKETTVYSCNFGLIGFKLKEGRHNITIQFSDNKIIVAFYYNIFLLIVFILFAGRLHILSALRKRKNIVD